LLLTYITYKENHKIILSRSSAEFIAFVRILAVVVATEAKHRVIFLPIPHTVWIVSVFSLAYRFDEVLSMINRIIWGPAGISEVF